MKLSALLLSIVILTINTSAQSNPFVPLEYEYPDSILSTPKTYVYKSPTSPVVRYKDVSRTDKPGQVIITWKQYSTPDKLVDSTILINDKIVEIYIFPNGQRIKQIITEDSVYKDGSRLGEKVQSGSFSVNPSMTLSTTIKS